MRTAISGIVLASLLTMGLTGEASRNSLLLEHNDSNDFQSVEDNENRMYKISDLDSITVDENGNVVENEISLFGWTINGSHIEPGQTKYYFPSDMPDGFPMGSYEIVEVEVSWGKNTSIEIGLEGGTHYTQSGTGTKVFLYPYSSGQHKLYIKNLGDFAIDVNGTIEY